VVYFCDLIILPSALAPPEGSTDLTPHLELFPENRKAAGVETQGGRDPHSIPKEQREVFCEGKVGHIADFHCICS
jgi:hypothetical protein